MATAALSASAPGPAHAGSPRSWTEACRAGRRRRTSSRPAVTAARRSTLTLKPGPEPTTSPSVVAYGRYAFQRFADVVATLVEVVQHGVELGRAPARTPCGCRRRSPKAVAETSSMPEISSASAARRASSAANNCVTVHDQLVDLSGPLGQHRSHRLRVCQEAFQSLVAFVQRARQRRDPVQRAAQLRGGVVQRVGENLQ